MVAELLNWPPASGVKVWPAPAKLNLFLHITGRREDGYHLLQTVFQMLDFGDELAFEPRDDGVIRLADAINGVAEQDNLVWRAASLLKKAAVTEASGNFGADIFLNKKLPMGGGLGGGSSNAATVLVALNQLWGLGYPVEKLAEIGLQLGADVPVFVHGHTAWAEGIGEILEPLTLPLRWYLVIYPGVHVSTVELFQHSELTRECTPITIRGFGSGSATGNVFQELVCRQQPVVSEVINVLLEQCSQAPSSDSDNLAYKPRMTGTGSCVFLAFDDESEARNMLRGVTQTVIAGHRVTGFVARGVNQSPLLSMV